MTRWLHCLLLSIATATATAQDAAKPDAVRAAIGRALDWVARQATPVKDVDGALLFPGTAELPKQREAIVYGGNAGVLIFLENAAAVLHDERARTLADATAKGLLSLRHKDTDEATTWTKKARGEGASGLYIGDAGIGAAFLVRARLRGDKEALKVATEIGDALLARGERDGELLHWDRQVEIIFGGAGTLLFLLELGEETKEQRFLDAAKATGRWLVAEAKSEHAEAEPHAQLLSWQWQMAGKQLYVNFAHGTSGVAYALARVGAATKDAVCTQAAKDGAEWVLAKAIHEGELLRLPVMATMNRSMGGWCHGPPGTGRLFLLLHQQTGDKRYLDAALASAHWVMAQAGSGEKDAPPPPFPPSLCCGVAGVLDFFCDLYRATGDQRFADFAARAGGWLIATAQADGDGLKWKNGSSPDAGNKEHHGVDLMQGASGEALALLRLLTIDQKTDPVRSLPDRSVGTR